MRISRYSADVETTLIDEETQRAIERLRFAAPLELQFRAWHLARNLPRTRAATAIYLGLIVVMTAINMLGAMAPLAESVLQPIYVLRVGIACPALALILAATFLATTAAVFPADRHGRDHRDRRQRDVDKRDRRGVRQSAVPDGRRARDRVRNAVPGPLVPRRRDRGRGPRGGVPERRRVRTACRHPISSSRPPCSWLRR